MTCDHAHDDGAYVLGALAPAERAAYEAHLTGCPACRNAVAEIAVLPGLLGRLDTAGLAQIATPPTMESRLPALLAAARRVRRRERQVNRWRYVGAALAAVCLALVVGLGVASLRSGSAAGTANPGVDLVAMQPVQGGSPFSAEIGFTGVDWGTKVTVRCRYPKRNEYSKPSTIRLVAHGANGATEQVGSWVATPGDNLMVTGATRFSNRELVRLELTRPDGTVLFAYDVP
jgi:hypothetical protein